MIELAQRPVFLVGFMGCGKSAVGRALAGLLGLAFLDTDRVIEEREGKTIAEPLADSKVFPPMVTQMVAVGEATGALDAMLTKIADFYDDEVDSAVEAMTALLEPMLMVFLGVVIGGLVIAMYLPVFKLAGAIG